MALFQTLHSLIIQFVSNYLSNLIHKLRLFSWSKWHFVSYRTPKFPILLSSALNQSIHKASVFRPEKQDFLRLPSPREVMLFSSSLLLSYLESISQGTATVLYKVSWTPRRTTCYFLSQQTVQRFNTKRAVMDGTRIELNMGYDPERMLLAELTLVNIG